MKTNLHESIEIPEGLSCKYGDNAFTCKSGQVEIVRPMHIPKVIVKVEGNKVTFDCKKGNKNEFKKIMTALAHLKNIFHGANTKYTYKMEVCNVHFPMTLKVDGSRLLINNFLGEKNPRIAKIAKGVTVEVKAPQVFVSSNDIEAAGQTAANIEKATKIRNRDRRVYQDGIFIVEKPGRDK